MAERAGRSPAIDSESEITLGLLEAVQADGALTQRSAASQLGIALGLTNAYLKRCVKKGLIKVKQVPPNRYSYYLTPKASPRSRALRPVPLLFLHHLPPRAQRVRRHLRRLRRARLAPRRPLRHRRRGRDRHPVRARTARGGDRGRGGARARARPRGRLPRPAARRLPHGAGARRRRYPHGPARAPGHLRLAARAAAGRPRARPTVPARDPRGGRYGRGGRFERVSRA